MNYLSHLQKRKNKIGSLSSFLPMTWNLPIKQIKNIDAKYPWIIHPNVVLVIPVIFVVIWIIIRVLFMCCILKLNLYIHGFKLISKVFFGNKNTKAISKTDHKVKVLWNPSLLPTLTHHSPAQQTKTALTEQFDVTTVVAYEMHQIYKRSTPTLPHPVPHASAFAVTELERVPKLMLSREMFQRAVDDSIPKTEKVHPYYLYWQKKSLT